MDSLVKIFLQRALNELAAAKALFEISNNKNQKESLQIEVEMTFYSAVIAHSYYSIFYAVKAVLLTKEIKTESPDVHKKTYEAFKEQFLDSGILDTKLFTIYKKIIVRADELLQIFKEEKWKRGHFTYQTIPQANKEPASQSMQNAALFLRNIKNVIEN